MPIAAIAEFDGMSKADYDSGRKKFDNEAVKKAGLLGFLAGSNATGWVIVQVWQSKEAQENFAANMPSGSPVPNRITLIDVTDQEVLALA